MSSTPTVSKIHFQQVKKIHRVVISSQEYIYIYIYIHLYNIFKYIYSFIQINKYK